MQIINALSIDWEYWWCNKFLKIANTNPHTDKIETSTIKILDLLNKYNTRATFFVLGITAKQYPELVKEIYQHGHEIALHGYSHKELGLLTEKEFETEIYTSLNILKDYKINGFRAPYFSLNNQTKWALKILQKYQFNYDSSIFPSNLAYHGSSQAPCSLYRPSFINIYQSDPSSSIIEFPVASLNTKLLRLPLGGGFYTRVIPIFFLKRGLKNINKHQPFLLYFHSWEIGSELPKENLKNFIRYPSRLTAYIRINSLYSKLEFFLQNFKFQSIQDAINQYLLNNNQI